MPLETRSARSTASQPGRNDPCPCGSGRKFKVCCGAAKTTAVRPGSPPRPARPAGGPSAEAYVKLAGQLTQSGNMRGAIDALEKAVSLRPDHPAAHYNLALAFLNTGMLPRAAAGFRRAIALKPDFAHAHFDLGRALEQLGNDIAAIDSYRKAVAIAPKMESALHHLARMLQVRGAIDDSITTYRLAAAAAPNTTSGRLHAARALMLEERHAEAEISLRRAIALDPKSSQAQWQLGNLLDLTSRIDEGRPFHRRAIELDPAMVPAYHSLMLGQKSTETDRPLLERMQRLAEQPSLTTQQRMQLLFAIAKGFEDLAEYATAIRYFDDGNKIRRLLTPFDRGRVTSAFDWLIETFTPAFFARHAALGAPDERPLLILGMPRTGTTLVEQIVSSHPSVAAGGELPFWNHVGVPLASPEFEGRIGAETAGIADAHRTELNRIGPEALRITDKNPYNFLWIGLIHLIFPRAHIIHCLRDPIDTCLSIYTTLFGAGYDRPCERSDLVFYYREYLRLMAHWHNVLPAGTILDVQYESLIADPESWSRRIVAHSGLNWDPACLAPEANTRVVRTASIFQARRPIYRSSLQRWRRYEPWLGALRDLLPASPAPSEELRA